MNFYFFLLGLGKKKKGICLWISERSAADQQEHSDSDLLMLSS